MAQTIWSATVRLGFMPVEYSRVRSQQTCRSNGRQNSSMSSTSNRPHARPHVPPSLLARADEVIE